MADSFKLPPFQETSNLSKKLATKFIASILGHHSIDFPAIEF